MKEKKPMKKGIKALIIIASIFAAIIISSFLFAVFNPRVKFLVGIARFAVEELNDSSFIGYNLDIMELCRDYANGDIEFDGDLIASDIEGFGYTSSAVIHGVRCFDKKQMSVKADAKVLFVDVGEVDFYAVDKTMYLIVPSLQNLAYSLTSDADLYPKAPMLNGNLSGEWFADNMGNFIEFANDIEIEETGEKLVDDDGTVSYEYAITIPTGKGEFIWQLLGMEVPKENIEFSMYITRGCKIRRINMDIDNVLPDAFVTVDGVSMGNVTLTKKLPDNEKVTVLLVKRGDYLYSNCIDVAFQYDTKDGNVYTGNGAVVYGKNNDGYDIQVKRLKAYKDGALIGQAYINGRVTTTNIEYEPISDAPIPLDSIKNYEWEELRDNMDQFLKDVTEDVKEKI